MVPPPPLPLLQGAYKEHMSLLLSDNCAWLSRLVNVFLLEFNASAMRLEVRNLIHGVWNHASREQQSNIFHMLTSKVEKAPAYGVNAAELMELIAFVLIKIDSEDFKHELKGSGTAWYGRMAYFIFSFGNIYKHLSWAEPGAGDTLKFLPLPYSWKFSGPGWLLPRI